MEKRDDLIDILKGIAIFLVIWGHAIQGFCGNEAVDKSEVYTFIYSFHMPLFMLLSGWVFNYTIKKYSLSQIIKRRIMQLGGAMVIWGTLYFGINIMLNCPVYQMNISSYIECIFGVWYLWTLLVISCVVAIAEKFMMGKFHILICVIAIPLLLLFYKGTSIIYMYPYFLIGYFTKKNIEKIDMLLKKGGNILIAFFPILLLYFRGGPMSRFSTS